MAGWQQAFGHGARVFGLAFHPNTPDVIASASEDETVRVWSRDSSSSAWQQTSCCRGHTSEVLRVAWSPDGRLLASGSADHTVRFWSVSTSLTEQSYTGTELAVLSGHPEEVYAVHFLPDAPTDSSTQQQQQQVQHATDELASSTIDSPAAAAPNPSGSSSSSSSSGSSLLLTASGESLYLWDLAAGQMLQQSAPLPVLQTFPAFAAAVQSSSQQQQQQQQAPRSGAVGAKPSSKRATAAANGNSVQDGSDEEGSDEGDAGFDESPPSYIFGVSVCAETLWAAATCSDGMLRLWDASRRALTEVAAVQVHTGQMGSTVSWLPHQPLCVSSISKQGQLVLQDVRLLGRPLLQQQLEGPVYDAVWMPVVAAAAGSANAAAAAAAGGGGGGSSSGGVTELQLVTVGRDSRLRAYTLTAAGLQQGQLAAPRILSAPSSYSGNLLALAATRDGRRLAAAGEAVEADALQQQQQQQELPHAAARRGSAAARRGRSKAAARLDFLRMADAEGVGQAAPSQSLMFSSSSSTMDAASVAAPGGHSGAANCAAASAGVLTRAPLFIYSV